jgi:hypothetical protein
LYILKFYILIFILVGLQFANFGQAIKIVAINDSVFVVKGSCKSVYEIVMINKNQYQTVQTSTFENKVDSVFTVIDPSIFKPSNLSIHGNVLYNFNYQSYLDTPYLQNDLVQQSVQTRLNFTLQQQYPFSVFITHRNSNSPYFINATDISFQFKENNMLDIQKKKLRKELDDVLANKKWQYSPQQLYQLEQEGLSKLSPKQLETLGLKALSELKSDSLFNKFDSLYSEYKNKKDKLTKLDNWLNNTNHSQEIIEEKEKQLREEILTKINKNDTLVSDTLSSKISAKKNKIDTTISKIEQKIAAKQKEFDKYLQEVSKIENKLKLVQKKYRDSIQNLIAKLNAVKDVNSLQQYIRLSKNDSNRLSSLQKLLLSIQQIGIGRSWLNYSDLTVKNVSLNGFNIEMNPNKFYIAAAVGKVNYRFRDFVIKDNAAGSTQSLALLRLGLGQKEKNNIIVTYYTGQKALLNQRGIADSQALKQIDGFSIESKINVDANNNFVLEYARSTYAGIENRLLQFKDKNNEAWSVQWQSNYIKTNTKVDAFYRKIGEDFQSFTLHPTNSNQDAWSIKVKQAFFKKKLTIDASIKKNDFNSPIAAPNFSNSTVFKSITITMQIPKYPYLSIGYFPTTQLLLGNNNLLYQNQFNTLNAVASYSYTLANHSMNTNAVFTKFYNQGSDSNFLYANATNITINQSIFKAPFVLQVVGSYIQQTQFTQLAIEPIITYQYKNIVSLTGSLKWNEFSNNKTLWGSMVGINILIKKIGSIDLQYTKTYLPNFNNNLLPVTMGRITFNREF